MKGPGARIAVAPARPDSEEKSHKKFRRIAYTLVAAAALGMGGASAAQAADIAPGWERYGVYATDGECQGKLKELGRAGKVDGGECYAEGRGYALDVHYK
ncbi:hypothetical protein [Streptomyces sp. NPDC088400]|uniref:hypothetical protein n=1 Tax=Streptomyces sp. NPDC088400 TaxID=3365861 RepID=UPI003816CC37